MTKEKQKKMLCVDDLRHAEYYQMQDVFDELYAKSQNGDTFTDLMKLVLSRENILLAYRNIKGNKGSKTPGTDKVAIDDVGKLSADEYIERLRFIVLASRHDNLRINTSLMVQLMNTKSNAQSTEFSDNRISLFSAQWGKCAVTGKEFQCLEDIHCHHKLPKSLGGTNKYENLVLVLPQVHRLIHATDTEIIQKYLHLLNLDKAQIAKLNKYREKANNEPLKLY